MSLKIDSRTGDKKQKSGSGMGASASPSIESLPGLVPHNTADVYGEYVCDCLAFVIYCPQHGNIGISKTGRGAWLPFVILKRSDLWQEAAEEGIAAILSKDNKDLFKQAAKLPFTKPEVIHIYRVQLTETLNFVTRITYATKILKPEGIKWNCCKSDKRLEWVSADDIVSGNLEKPWGPEPFLFSEKAMQPKITSRQVVEFSLEDVRKNMPQEPSRGKEDDMLISANFLEKEMTKIYGDYVTHCYPSEYMSYDSFIDFMNKIGWTKSDIRLQPIFRAFCFKKKLYLTYHELSFGLAAMEPGSQHSGAVGEVRCGYIFRYYDVNNDGFLDRQDIFRMTDDIFRLKDAEVDEATIEKETNNRMQAMGLKQTDRLAPPAFLKAVGALTFRGTSGLFRSEASCLEKIMQKAKYEPTQDAVASPAGIGRRNYEGVCPGCMAKRYKLTIHHVKVEFSGRIVDPRRFIDTDEKDLTFTSEDALTEQLRQYSRETVFNPNSGPNSVLQKLRLFASATFKKDDKGAAESKWLATDKNLLLNSITTLCRQAEEIFAQEPRCLKVRSPVFVYGDIHGNFNDMITYERLFWKMAPTVIPSSFLFLGDYVDRGEYGIEVVAYILALKILAPDKYYFCRGNHEIRSVQKTFTFHTECLKRYGAKIGPEVWEAFNKVFDRMPIAAVIDECIFGSHGGIPTTVLKIDDLLKILVPLSDPERDSPCAWEMMWNDPLDQGDFTDLAEFMKARADATNGFLTNAKRGTAYYFAEEALANFLETNGLSYVLRGHEMVNPGYKFHFQGKVITIFSSSRYCGNNNEAACLFIDDGKIRLIKIETSKQ